MCLFLFSSFCLLLDDQPPTVAGVYYLSLNVVTALLSTLLRDGAMVSQQHHHRHE
jgi:hypothetical protein